MKCPNCNFEMRPATDLIGSTGLVKTGLPPNFVIESEFRCTHCTYPIVLISEVWYKWYNRSRNDCGWEPYSGPEMKPRKISSNFVTGKRLFQT